MEDDKADTRKFRNQTVVDEMELRPNSLVGSFFMGDDERQCQGLVVAEPVPGIYLCEMFSWLGGDSTEQNLFRIEDMMDWHFYDHAHWMRNAYRNGIGDRWHSISGQEEKEPADSPMPKRGKMVAASGRAAP